MNSNCSNLLDLRNLHEQNKNGILLPNCEKNCSSEQEKAEGREFAQFLRSLEQFIQTVKGQNNFW